MRVEGNRDMTPNGSGVSFWGPESGLELDSDDIYYILSILKPTVYFKMVDFFGMWIISHLGYNFKYFRVDETFNKFYCNYTTPVVPNQNTAIK